MTSISTRSLSACWMYYSNWRRMSTKWSPVPQFPPIRLPNWSQWAPNTLRVIAVQMQIWTASGRRFNAFPSSSHPLTVQQWTAIGRRVPYGCTSNCHPHLRTMRVWCSFRNWARYGCTGSFQNRCLMTDSADPVVQYVAHVVRMTNMFN